MLTLAYTITISLYHDKRLNNLAELETTVQDEEHTIFQ
jgi:hypothetical protein